VESSCKLGNEPLGSIKCWELPNGCTTCGISSGTQLEDLVSVCGRHLHVTLVLNEQKEADFDILTLLTLRTTTIWHVMLCSLVEVH
jgi:hypothetical protein